MSTRTREDVERAEAITATMAETLGCQGCDHPSSYTDLIADALGEARREERERIIALFGPGGPHFGPFGKKLARIIREGT